MKTHTLEFKRCWIVNGHTGIEQGWGVIVEEFGMITRGEAVLFFNGKGYDFHEPSYCFFDLNSAENHYIKQKETIKKYFIKEMRKTVKN